MLDAEKLISALVLLFILSIILMIVIICVVIYNNRFIKNFTTQINDDYDNYKTKLKEQNDALIGQVLTQLSEQNNTTVGNDMPIKNLMNIFMKLKDSIKENCVATMNKIGAVRIAIYLFHNGTHTTHGISFFKMSCMCEKVVIGSGVKERMMEHTSIPLNLFDEMFDLLVTNNRFIIINNDETQETNHKMFISADKINYAQLVPIYDVNNNMLGFVAVEMTKHLSMDEVDKETEILNELVKQLVPVLSYSDYALIKTP